MKYLETIFRIAIVLVCFFCQSGHADEKPNVLFISVDDMNCDLSIYGFEQMPMPNLQRLANLGVRFDKAYCQQPLCGPSRASLMTGLRPDTIDMHNLKHDLRKKNPDVVTLGQMFRQNGYFSARVGKIYHYNNPSSIGTDGNDDPATWDERYNPAGIDKLHEDKIIRFSKNHGLGRSLSYWAPESADEEHTDGIVAKTIIELIAKHKEKPFFLAAGFYRPHCPYVAPKKYFDQIPKDSIEIPDLVSSKKDLDDVPPMAITQDSKNWPFFFPDISVEQAKICKRAYFASNAFLDAQIGKILDALDHYHLLDKTIIVFWSDHGYFLGEKGLWYKRKAFEKSARVPMIISGPGIAKKSVAQQTVELLDIYPTLADCCGLKPPANLEGISMRNILQDPVDAERNRPAVTQVWYNKKAWGYSIRTNRWRYTQWRKGFSGHELYDHASDPDETINLADSNEHHHIVEKLAKQLQPYVRLKPYKLGPIEKQIVVKQDIETVWQAITDPKKMKQWLFSEIEKFEPRAGFQSKFVVNIEGRKFEHCWKVVEAEAPNTLRYKWSYTGIPGKSEVRWSLKKVDGGTQLRFAHIGTDSFDQSDPMFKREVGEAGWNYLILQSLPKFLAEAGSHN